MTEKRRKELSSISILIVEDSERDGMLMRRAFESEGFAVTVRRVETAEALASALREQAWDVVLSDSVMPAFSGAEALRQVRETATDTPFIVISGKIGEEQAAALIKAGADDFVSKERMLHLPATTRREIKARKLRRRLAERERTLQGVISHLPGFIFRREMGPDGRVGYAFVSPSVADYMGVEAEALLEDPNAIWRYVPRQFREQAEAEIRRSAKAEDAADFEILVRRTHRNDRWIHVTASPTTDDSGKRVWDGIALDVTEQRLSSDEAREASARAESALALQTAILDTLPANVALIDATGTITAVNRRWRDFAVANGLHWTSGTIGVNYLAVCDRGGREGVEGAAEAAHGLRALLAGGGDGLSLEYPCHSPSERRWFRLMAAPLTGRDSFSAVVMHVDITAEKEAELARRESETRLASIAENLPGFIFRRVVRPDGRGEWSYISPSFGRILGIAPEKIQATPNAYFERIPQPYRDELIAEMQAAAREVRPSHSEYPIDAWDGVTRWLRSSTQPRMLDHGCVEWNGLVLDVTAEKAAEEESAELEARLGSITSALPGFVFRRRVDPDGRTTWLYVSPSLETVLGIPVDEVLSHPDSFFERMPAMHRQRFFGGMHAAASADKPHDFEYPLRGGHGEKRWIRGSAVPRRLPDGTAEWDGLAIDVTSEKQAEAAFREAQEQLQGIARNLPGFLFRRVQSADGATRLTYVSESVRELYGIDPEALVNDPDLFWRTVHPDDRDKLRDVMGAGAGARTTQKIEYRFLSADGTERWIRVHAQLSSMENGDIAWDGLGLDVTAEREAEERLNFLAYYDPVTGLPNRVLLADRLQQAAAYADRYGCAVALHYIDLDHFKEVNDTLGHAVGDRLLQEVGGILSELVRRTDTVARIGGDEFLIVQQDVNEPDMAALFAQKILTRLKRPIIVDDHRIVAGASIGISLYPDAGAERGSDPTELLKFADMAMYEAKTLGGDAYRFFDSDSHARTQQRMTLRQALHDAVENWEFAFHYQPQVDFRAGVVLGAEALIRWDRPGVGLVSPAEFLPLAEQSGLIVPIGARALIETMREASTWQSTGDNPLTLAVNVSGAQLRREGFGDMVRAALEETGFDPGRLELELTETELMVQSQMVLETLEELSALGVSFAVDDFGTGYSSFEYLKTFPIRKLKIDKSFVRDMMTDPRDASIVAAMIMAAKGLELDLVAEGIETEAERNRLLEQGCHCGQGYLFSRPLPSDAFRALLGQSGDNSGV